MWTFPRMIWRTTIWQCLNAMDFFKEGVSLKKLIREHFFTSFLNDLSIEDLLTLGNLLSTKFMNPQRQFYSTLGRWAWVPQELRNKFFKLLVNRQMIGLALKSWNMYDDRKTNKLEIEWKTKILFVTLNCSITDVWRWIFVQITEGNINLWKIKIKLLLNLSNLEQIPSDCWDKLLIKKLNQRNKW